MLSGRVGSVSSEKEMMERIMRAWIRRLKARAVGSSVVSRISFRRALTERVRVGGAGSERGESCMNTPSLLAPIVRPHRAAVKLRDGGRRTEDGRRTLTPNPSPNTEERGVRNRLVVWFLVSGFCSLSVL
jgi:hypothetical protein